MPEEVGRTLVLPSLTRRRRRPVLDQTFNSELDIHNCDGRCAVAADEGLYLINPSILSQTFTAVMVGAL